MPGFCRGSVGSLLTPIHRASEPSRKRKRPRGRWHGRHRVGDEDGGQHPGSRGGGVQRHRRAHASWNRFAGDGGEDGEGRVQGTGRTWPEQGQNLVLRLFGMIS